MSNTYELVEKFELIDWPAEDGPRLIKTWRTFILLKNDDSLFVSFQTEKGVIVRSTESFGTMCEEIIIDATSNIRIGGERFIEECDPEDVGLLPLLQSLAAAKPKHSTPDYIRFEKQQSDLKCAELNTETLLRIGEEIRELRRLPMVIGGNSDNRSQLMFTENVLHYFSHWYKGADIMPPLDINSFWPTDDQNHESMIGIEKLEIDQDDFIDKFRRACEERGLKKGKTIGAKILFEIGMQLCPNDMPDIGSFKSGTSMYTRLRVFAAETGYKKPREPEK